MLFPAHSAPHAGTLQSMHGIDTLGRHHLSRLIAITPLRGGCSRPAASRAQKCCAPREGRKLAARGSARGDSRSGSSEPQPVKPWGLLMLLLAVYVHNQWSRNALQYSVNFAVSPSAEASREFVNVALGISKSEYAILASYAFILLYTVFSLVSGRVAGESLRRLLLDRVVERHLGAGVAVL